MRTLRADQTRIQANRPVLAWIFRWAYAVSTLICVYCIPQLNAAPSSNAASNNVLAPLGLAPLDLAPLGDAYFETIGDSEAIPDNNVTAIAEDASGLIWIGTPSGLIRYDGYRFRRYTRDSNTPNSLSGVFIRALALATDGKLWIGTDADGVSVYDPQTEAFTQFRHRDNDASSLSHNTVRVLAATPDGGMWVGTRSGLNLQRGGRTDFQQFPLRLGSGTLDLDDRILSLLLDKRGELWVGSWNGLSRLSPGRSTFVRVQEAGSSSLVRELIMSLYELHDGRIGIGTNLQGSMIFDPSNGSLLPIPTKQGIATPTEAMALAMLQPKPGELWLGSFGGIEIINTAPSLPVGMGVPIGAVLQQLRPDPSVQSSLAHAQVRAMMQDRSGHIWIGGYSGGLQRHDPNNSAIRVLHHSPMRPNGLSSPSVGSILERSNGELWLGLRENGIDIIERSSGRLRSLKPEAGNPDALGNGMVISLAETADHAVWAGTLAGLFRFDPVTLKFRGYGERAGVRGSTIRRLLGGKNGELWIGTNTGLFRWTPDPGNGRDGNDMDTGPDPEQDNVGDDAIDAIKMADGSDLNADVNALALQSDGRLWVGSTIGLHTLAPELSGLKTVQGELNGGAQSAKPSIVGLLVDRQNRVWVDTSEGLNVLTQLQESGDHAKAVFDPVSDRLGIGGKSFGANLLEDASGRIWTQQHVLASDAKSVYVLSKADGVEFGTAWFRSYASTHDGLLLFGGSKGVLIVEPQKFQPRRYQPPLIATELSVAGQVRPIGEIVRGLELQPGAANFSVEFAALDYSAPQRVRYRHRLIGFDQGWIETDANRRMASYTNLAPGNYTLQVRAQTPASGWTPHALTFSVRALPAYWQTTWFTLAMAVLGIAIVYVAVRRHAQRVGRHERELEHMVAERTLELSLAKESAEHALEQLRGTQKQLVQAEKMASLGQLVAGVAHELNTPLGIALTASSMLSDESRALKKSVAAQSLSTRQLSGYLDVAERAGAMVDTSLARAAQLVRSFKQVSLDRSTDERRRFELSGYLADLLTGLELSWKRRPVQLALTCAPGLILDSYPDALGQIIGTLSQNALQHAFAADAIGKMQISAESIVLESGANAVRLVFSDDGKGISEADLAHVFEPFFTTKRGQGSTGLGLHIVFNLVHARLGGEIEVASTLGEGTRFTVTFPCVAP